MPCWCLGVDCIQWLTTRLFERLGTLAVQKSAKCLPQLAIRGKPPPASLLCCRSTARSQCARTEPRLVHIHVPHTTRLVMLSASRGPTRFWSLCQRQGNPQMMSIGTIYARKCVPCGINTHVTCTACSMYAFWGCPLSCLHTCCTIVRERGATHVTLHARNVS